MPLTEPLFALLIKKSINKGFRILSTASTLPAKDTRCSAIGLFDPKFQVEGVAPTNHSSSQKTRLNDLSYDIKFWTDLSSILSQITRLSDRQTDGQTEFLSLDRVCIACCTVIKRKQGEKF